MDSTIRESHSSEVNSVGLQAFTHIERNVTAIRNRIDAAAARTGRNSEDVRLIAVTKSVGPSQVEALHACGVRAFGENRLPGVPDKQAMAPRETAEWHMVGHLQRRKAREVVGLFDWVDSIDRLKLAETLQRQCEEQDRQLRVLLEVNVSGESTKHGLAPEEVEGVLTAIRPLDRLSVEGVMTMAPLADDPEDVRPVFARLRELADDFGLPERSMGMSNDFEVAVEEGATQVRIGTALFV
ncbi:MAG: YggS family pyridoxal phosphate-dependent enzyme [Candidatus Hydrogenedentota bacterium]